MTKVSVFMPSFNKGGYVLDGIRSVVAQTMPDWELWVMENSTDDATRELIRDSGLLDDSRIIYEDIDLSPDKRGSVNMMGWLLNQYYPLANGEYIFYLSDDDLVDPECFAEMAGYLDDTGYDVCWASLRCTGCSGPGDVGPFENSGIAAREIKEQGRIDGLVDGGQIMHRKTCLDNLDRPYFYEGNVYDMARHIDGMFMEKLAGYCKFYPVDKWLMTHRFTSVSTYTKGGPGYVSMFREQ